MARDRVCGLGEKLRHWQHAEGFRPRENTGLPQWVQELDPWIRIPALLSASRVTSIKVLRCASILLSVKWV